MAFGARDMHRSMSSRSDAEAQEKKATANMASSFVDPDGDAMDVMLYSGTHHKLLNRMGIDLTGRASVLVRGQPKQAPFRLHVGFQTTKGSDQTVRGVRIKKKNQDSLAVLTPFGQRKSMSFFAVFDGHGKDGHSVSMFATQAVAQSLKRMVLKFDPVRALKESIIMTNQELEGHKKIDSFVSGTTAVMVLLSGRDLYCCNVGDSRCVLARRFGDVYEAVPLSFDHKPDRPSERRRILSKGGKVQAYRPYEVDGLSSSSRVWITKDKTSHKNMGPGLAVSRAFGDFLFSKVGVACAPEITKIALSAADKFFILASDGVFSVMTSHEVIDLVASYWTEVKSAREVSTKITNEAARRWQEQDDGESDDITCVVVFLEPVDTDSARMTSEPQVVCDMAPDEKPATEA